MRDFIHICFPELRSLIFVVFQIRTFQVLTPLLTVHDKFPMSQEMCLSLDSTEERASIVTQLWAQKYPDINGVGRKMVLSLLSSLSFPPQFPLGTQQEAAFLVSGRGALLVGVFCPLSTPLPATLHPRLHLQSASAAFLWLR